MFKKCRLIDIENKKEANVRSFSIFKRDGFTCIYCGKSSIEDGIKLNIEHIIPISKGGKTHINNLITSCEECNVCKNEHRLDGNTETRITLVLNNRNLILNQPQKIDIEKEILVLAVADKQRVKQL